MEARYYYAMNSRHFLRYLQNIPQATLDKWRNKYGVETDAESDALIYQHVSRPVRTSSSSYIWR